MKTIIYNDDEIDESVINNVVKRAKLMIINSNNDVSIVFSHFNYFFVGGHIEGDETDLECLKREIKEEMGVFIPLNDMKKIMEIRYLSKDYPNDGINTLSIINYYFIKSDVLEDVNNLNLDLEMKKEEK